MTSSVAGLRRSSKALPKATPASKIWSWSLFGGPPLIWFSTAFWIPAKPLHLRNVLSKLMRCIKNCNACSQHWSTESPILFHNNTWPTTHGTKNASKVKQIVQQSFASSVIFTWTLANWPPLEISKIFCRELTFTASRRQKMLSKNLSNPDTWIFMLQNKQIYFSLAKMCWL